MSEEQPVFKVVDRRPFNPDGTPRELTQQEKEDQRGDDTVVTAGNVLER